MPDSMRIGGITGWMRSAAIAGAAGLPLSRHLYPEVSAHLRGVSQAVHWIGWRDLDHPLIMEPFAVENGYVIAPDRPGNGIAWHEQAVAQYKI